MITPQQIDQISFSQTRHGYDMEQVDKILEPLTEDYVTLYKENALLKSKMRVLVGKLEEYRKNEAAARDAVESAKRSAEKVMQDAQAKAAQMLRQAQAAAASAPVATAAKGPSADALVAVEKARVAEARKAAATRITEIQTQMQQCIQALDRIKNANVTPAAAPAARVAPAAPVAPAPAAAPAPTPAPAAPAKQAAPEDVYDSDAVVGEISQSLEAMVGTTNDTAPKAVPQHPAHDTTTSRFSNLNLQFGRNYDPTQK